MHRLARAGRIISRLGDLTGPSTLHEIAETARKTGVPVHAIYLSNAESWFRTAPPSRGNVSACPLDDRSVILRTIKSAVLPYPAGDIWHYTIQRAQHFADGLSQPPTARSTSRWSMPCRTDARHLADRLPAQDRSDPTPRRQKSRERRDGKSALIASGLVTRPPAAANRPRNGPRPPPPRPARTLPNQLIRRPSSKFPPISPVKAGAARDLFFGAPTEKAFWKANPSRAARSRRRNLQRALSPSSHPPTPKKPAFTVELGCEIVAEQDVALSGGRARFAASCHG